MADRENSLDRREANFRKLSGGYLLDRCRRSNQIVRPNVRAPANAMIPQVLAHGPTWKYAARTPAQPKMIVPTQYNGSGRGRYRNRFIVAITRRPTNQMAAKVRYPLTDSGVASGGSGHASGLRVNRFPPGFLQNYASNGRGPRIRRRKSRNAVAIWWPRARTVGSLAGPDFRTLTVRRQHRTARVRASSDLDDQSTP